ncbi:YceI family protein [bacterium]|nr:YceI family protein [bacterium]
MKHTALLILALLLTVATAGAQDKYISKNGHVWFYSQTPLETIEAHNHEVASILTPSTGELAFQLLIKAFKFDRALMEEHFNENYMESSKYPKSDFRGTITNLDDINFSKDGTYKATVEGKLTIHNKTNSVKETGTIKVSKGTIRISAKFDVKPEDYGIEIPGVVRDKIAKSFEVTVDMTYKPYKK